MTTELIESVGSYAVEITGENDLTNAGLGDIANPEGVALVITKCTLYIDTPSTGAANLSIGIGASGAASSTLISALAVNGAITGKAYNGLNPAAKSELDVWAADEYLNITGSADSSGFVGKLFLEYQRVE